MDIEQANIIHMIYETIESPDKWDQVLQQISRKTGSSHAFMAARSGVDESPIGFFENGFENGHFERYQEHFYQVDVWTQGLAFNKFNQFHASHEVCDDKSFLNSEIYNDFARPVDIRHSIGCLLAPPGENIITELAFMRGTQQQHFDRQTISQVNTYLPHIQQSLTLAQKLQSIQQEKVKVDEVFNGLSEALIVCSNQNQIEFYNRAAESFLNRTKLIKPNLKNQLIFQNSEIQARLLEASEACLNSLDGIQTSIEPCFKKQFYFSDNATQYRVQLKPWLHKRMTPWGEQRIPGVVISIAPSAMSRYIAPEEVQEHFPLTRSEADICSRLANGMTLQAIAEIRDASLSTVRQQIKTCLAKTSSGSQLEMLNKLLRLLLVD